MAQNRPKGATRIRRMKCRVIEQSTLEATLANVFDQLLSPKSPRDQLENIEVLRASIEYVIQHSCWPSTKEIAAISGFDLDRVSAVEERLGGTYEFALRAGLIEDSGL